MLPLPSSPWNEKLGCLETVAWLVLLWSLDRSSSTGPNDGLISDALEARDEDLLSGNPPPPPVGEDMPDIGGEATGEDRWDPEGPRLVETFLRRPAFPAEPVPPPVPVISGMVPVEGWAERACGGKYDLGWGVLPLSSSESSWWVVNGAPVLLDMSTLLPWPGWTLPKRSASSDSVVSASANDRASRTAMAKASLGRDDHRGYNIEQWMYSRAISHSPFISIAMTRRSSARLSGPAPPVEGSPKPDASPTRKRRRVSTAAAKVETNGQDVVKEEEAYVAHEEPATVREESAKKPRKPRKSKVALEDEVWPERHWLSRCAVCAILS